MVPEPDKDLPVDDLLLAVVGNVKENGTEISTAAFRSFMGMVVSNVNSMATEENVENELTLNKLLTERVVIIEGAEDSPLPSVVGGEVVGVVVGVVVRRVAVGQICRGVVSEHNT